MYDINYINDFKKVIEDIVDARIKKNGITNYVSAKVINVNNDNTVDVIIPPDNTKYIKNLLNKTGETLKNGDSVELCTKNGKLSNAWVSVKHGKGNGGASGGWPIGSIYISVVNTNPSNYFGGTWEQIKDRFLLACGSTYSNGSTGGEATHTLTVNEIPSHNHPIKNTNVGGGVTTYNTVKAEDKRGWGGNIYTDNSGGGQAHNNMPPYLAVYIWKRVA